jgi:hypothetical protein
MKFSDFYEMLGITDENIDKSAFYIHRGVATPFINELEYGDLKLFELYQREQGDPSDSKSWAYNIEQKDYIYFFISDELGKRFHKKFEVIHNEYSTIQDLLDTKEISNKTYEKYCKLIADNKLPNNTSKTAKLLKYALVKTPGELEDRLVIEYNDMASKGLLFKTHKDTNVVTVLPKKSATNFKSYEDVFLTYEQLKEVVKDKNWQEKLSRVAGVYCIFDKETGKQYVGSASGEKEGLLQRWKNYADDFSGDNVELKELQDKDPDYATNNFIWSILETLPLSKNSDYVLEAESRWKKKLGTREFGLNAN